MIVKVQQSLTTGEPVPQCLIYNRSRTVLGQIPLPEDVKKALGNRPKAYFRARQDKDGHVHLLQEVKAQDW